MLPSPLVMLSPMNSSFSARGSTGSKPPSVSIAQICSRLSGSPLIACVSFTMRTFLTVSGFMPRNTQTRCVPFSAMRRDRNSPLTTKLYHGSYIDQSAESSTQSSPPRTLTSSPEAVQNSVSGSVSPFVRPCTRCGTCEIVQRFIVSFSFPSPRGFSARSAVFLSYYIGIRGKRQPPPKIGADIAPQRCGKTARRRNAKAPPLPEGKRRGRVKLSVLLRDGRRFPCRSGGSPRCPCRSGRNRA